MTDFDRAQLIQPFDLAAIPDDYETLCEAGRLIAEASDRNRWALGRLAMRVVKAYGEDVFDHFARDIGMKSKTLYGYREVSQFYGENSAYAENLQWTHYRTAMRLDTLDCAEWALLKAADKGWTATRFEMLISRLLGQRKKKARKLVDTVAKVTVIDSTGELGLFADGAQTAKLHAGQTIRFVAYEVIE